MAGPLSPLLLVVVLAVLLHNAPPLHAASSLSQLAKNARIGIVGAGSAGLHMAYLLRNLGFTNLVVLESTKSVGGRSWSVSDESGLIHEMGTCYLSSDYSDLRRMAQRIKYNLEEVNLPSAVVRTPVVNGNDGKLMQLTLAQFISSRVIQLDPGLGSNPSLTDVQNRISLAAERYLALRKRLFPHPVYFEYPLTQPPPDALSRLNCTILEFLRTNSLMALEPFFLVGMTAMGYGSLADTSAIYGLMWMSPDLLNDLIGSRDSSKLTMLRRGYLSLWKGLYENLASRENVEFRFNSLVTRASRQGNKVLLELNRKTTDTFDWLVWTPNILKTAGTFADLTPDERHVFGHLSGRKFHTRLIRLPAPEPSVASEPIIYYLEMLDSPGQIGRLLAVRNTAKVMKKSTSQGQSTLVAYYLSSYAQGGSDIKKPEGITEDEKTLNDVGGTLQVATFDYMPRFSVQQMAGGVLWRILRSVQGARQTWFAGHSVVFDSVKSVMKYNKMLLATAFPDLEAQLADM